MTTDGSSDADHYHFLGVLVFGIVVACNFTFFHSWRHSWLPNRIPSLLLGASVSLLMAISHLASLDTGQAPCADAFFTTIFSRAFSHSQLRCTRTNHPRTNRLQTAALMLIQLTSVMGEQLFSSATNARMTMPMKMVWTHMIKIQWEDLLKWWRVSKSKFHEESYWQRKDFWKWRSLILIWSFKIKFKDEEFWNQNVTRKLVGKEKIFGNDAGPLPLNVMDTIQKVPNKEYGNNRELRLMKLQWEDLFERRPIISILVVVIFDNFYIYVISLIGTIKVNMKQGAADPVCGLP